MVLSLTADELVQAHFDSLIEEGQQKQVGLVVGRCGSKRDLVVAVIPTPAVGGVDPVRLSRGSSGGGAASAATPVSVSVSAESVAEHARQTSLLLPGGLSVVGLSLLAPGGLAAAGAETSLLLAWSEAVRGSAASDGCRLGSSSPSSGGGGGGGGILLGADASGRGRVAAREILPGASPPLRHADIRFAPVLTKLVSLRATYPVAARVDACSSSPSASSKKRKKKGAPPLSDLLLAVAAAEAARARQSIALGARGAARPRALDLDASVADSLGELGEPEAAAAAGGGGGSGGAREVMLLPPAVSCSPFFESDGDSDGSDGDGDGSDGEDDSRGTLRLEGWVEARALVHERDSVREAVEALAADVGATVGARAAAAVEEAEAEADEGEGPAPPPPLLAPPPSGSPLVVPLARRVLFPLLPGGGGGSSAPAALVVGGDLALPPRRSGGGGGGGGGGGERGDGADGEGALDAAAQLCGRDDLTLDDLVFAEGRAEGATAAGVAASSLSPSSSSSSSARQRRQEPGQQPGREAAAASAAAAATAATARGPTAAPSASTATAAISPMPLAAAGAVAAATLALALGVYLTLA